MEAREFVKYAKRYAVDDSVEDVVRELTVPKAFPSSSASSDWFGQREAESKNKREWFLSLNPEEQTHVRALLQECSERTLLNLFCLIDGVGGEYEGVFEIVSVDKIERTTINPENTEMLHDLLSEICEEDREPQGK